MKTHPPVLTSREVKLLGKVAAFRYQLRQFLRFSERAARGCGVTPQQHQMLLGVAGFTGRGWATISELAEFLQERHNAVVSVVGRAARRGLIGKEQSAIDRRVVRVFLLRKGARLLRELTRLHQQELGQFRLGLANLPLSSDSAHGRAKKSLAGKGRWARQERRPRRASSK